MKVESGKWKVESGLTRKILRAVLVVLLLSTLTSCKKYSVECELVVRPYVKITSGSDDHTLGYLIRVYAFYTDEKDYLNPRWRPASWVNAEAGLIRNVATGEVRSHDLMGGQSPEDGYVHLTLTSSPMVLVAVDPVNKFYAWRTFKYEVPLERLYVPVSFEIYQSSYKKYEWNVASEKSDNTPPEEVES
jgi:hypothetical protein